jgi:hypothetical protein
LRQWCGCCSRTYKVDVKKIKDNHRRPARHLVARGGHEEVVLLLLKDFNADVGVEDLLRTMFELITFIKDIVT